MTTFDKLESIQALKQYYDTELAKTHLKTLLQDTQRNEMLVTECPGFIFDATHTKLDPKALELLQKVADETKIFDKIQAMASG